MNPTDVSVRDDAGWHLLNLHRLEVKRGDTDAAQLSRQLPLRLLDSWVLETAGRQFPSSLGKLRVGPFVHVEAGAEPVTFTAFGVFACELRDGSPVYCYASRPPDVRRAQDLERTLNRGPSAAAGRFALRVRLIRCATMSKGQPNRPPVLVARIEGVAARRTGP